MNEFGRLSVNGRNYSDRDGGCLIFFHHLHLLGEVRALGLPVQSGIDGLRLFFWFKSNSLTY